ncbi:MAG TPA: glycosyltransferase family 4 protein [Candidatus Andersenbacteria bacterium]|nr:glycosyltransferase family 4 protein [Candidatus Andersenbacteria bacterium]
MKILHTALRYPPATGGAETYIQQIVERTRSIEHHRDVRVLTSSMRTHGPIGLLPPEALLDDPIYVQRLRVSKTPYISYPRLQALSYYLEHHKPDILESYGFWYQMADASARYAKKHHIPFIFHPIYYSNRIRRKRIWQLYKNTIGKATFKTADVVVVLSEFEKRLIIKSNMPVERFAVVPPGIDTVSFSVSQDNPFTKRNIAGTILLCVSRVAKSKGLQDVIQALPDIIKNIPDAKLVIAGEDFGYANKLLTLATTLGVQHRVHMLGRVSDNELIGAYQHARLFIHASHYEAFGIVVAEAMAAACPVVARNATAIPYVMPHEQAGLLFSTHNELVESIITICNDENIAKRFGTYGKDHVQKHFTWDASIAKLIKIYDEFKT